jgi:ferrous iron transport protein B
LASTTEKQAIDLQISSIETQMNSEQLENSWLGSIGHFIEPVIKPLGFEWRMGIALLSGTAAKEVVVSTMGVLLQAEDTGSADGQTLIYRLQTLKHESGKKVGQLVFTPLVAFGFLIFILIYSPCIGVVAAIAKESGRWRWALFMVSYTTGLAWLLSFLIYQIGSFFV